MSERTFAIIKPDAVAAGTSGNIPAEIESAGFTIVAMKKMHLSTAQAGGFYHVHRERGFFGELVGLSAPPAAGAGVGTTRPNS